MKIQLHLLLALGLLFGMKTVAQETMVQPNPEKKQQTIEGWGSSLCWWAHMVGQWDDEAKIDDIVDLITDPDKLNMNIFRYNIGGGDDPSHYSTPGNPGHMANGKGVRAEMEGFLSGEDEPYDWTADAGQRKVMLKIKEKRPDAVFEAFSNSPPYWMTYSGCSAGNDPAGADNLKPEYYGQFSDYLLEVCKHYKDTYGLEFKTLEPFNESLSSFWGYLGGQEGCHYDASSQIAVIRELYPKLQTSGLNTVISASDETNIGSFLYAMNSYLNAGDIMGKLGQINTHTYGGNNNERQEAHNISKLTGLPLWQSETGPIGLGGSGFANNLQLAQRMFDDLNIMKPVVWLEWQLMEEWNDTWCQIRCSFENETYYVVKNLYVRMQVTRFIKQGYHILESNADNVLMAMNEQNSELVVVLLNTGDSQESFSLDLGAFNAHGNEATIYRTSESEDCKQLSNVAISGSELNYSAPASSISTLVIPVEYTAYSSFAITHGITFEDYKLHGFSGSDIAVKKNGYSDNLNGSQHVLQTSFNTDRIFSYIFESEFLTSAAYRYLHMMIKSPGASADITAFYYEDDTITITAGNTWTDIVIDLHENRKLSELILKNATAGSELLLDNVMINNDPDPVMVNEMPPFFDFESPAGTPQIMLLPFSSSAEQNVISNAAFVGLNTSAHILEYLIPAVQNASAVEDTLEIRLASPLKITDASRYLHFLAKSPSNMISVAVNGIQQTFSITQGEWTDLVIDLESLKGEIVYSVFISPYGSTGIGTLHYLDDITFNDQADPVTHVFHEPDEASYLIYSRNSSNAIAASGSGLIQNTPDKQDANQLWEFHAVDGAYLISNHESGLAFTDEDVYALALDEPKADYDGQLFTVSETDGGYVKIESEKSGLAVDVEAESTSAGANIGLWEFGSSNNEHRQWALLKISDNDTQLVELSDAQSHVSVVSGEGYMRLQNLPENAGIYVYNMSGQLLHVGHALVTEYTCMLSPGIYVVQVENTKKIISLKGMVY